MQSINNACSVFRVGGIRGAARDRHSRASVCDVSIFASHRAANALHAGRRFEKGNGALSRIRIGASNHLANRPLVFGLSERAPNGVDLVYDEPGSLALSLEKGDLDAALIPSIEFLRGVGEHSIRGPALVAKGRTMGLVLVADKPLPEVSRIAVGEFSRTPLVALRAVLHRIHGVLPDLCVVKDRPLDASNWRESFDAALLTDDEGLEYACRGRRPGETCHDVGEMWCSFYSPALVISVWAYNDGRLGETLESILVSSRDRGMESLGAIANAAAAKSSFNADFFHHYFSSAWGFHLGPEEDEALRVLEDVAFEYQLLQTRRLERTAIT